MAETARLPQWQPQMQAMKNRRPLAEAEEYYDILTAASCSVDIWRTTYYHIMPDAEAIVHWFRATGLRPFLNRLTEAEQAAFCADYLEKLRAAYPQQADGNVLLAFPRLFFVAEKK
jgi:trans-aconitate 2-methyltransferase